MSAALGLGFVLFIAAQGAVIFATALAALRILRADVRLARLPAMVVSYGAWIVATITGYGLLGGEGGLMDGFGLVIMLCFTALISTLIYTVLWMLVPSFNRGGSND